MRFTDTISETDRQALLAHFPQVRIRNLAREVCDLAGLSFEAVLGPGRQAELVAARHWVMYVAYAQGHTMPRIAAALRRDHTTVLHGISAEAARRGEGPEAVRRRHAEAQGVTR